MGLCAQSAGLEARLYGRQDACRNGRCEATASDVVSEVHGFSQALSCPTVDSNSSGGRASLTGGQQRHFVLIVGEI